MGLYDAPSLISLKVQRFKGLDCSVPEDQMQPFRAADCENLIPGAAGEVKKRPGVHYTGAAGFAGTVEEAADGRVLIVRRTVDNVQGYVVRALMNGSAWIEIVRVRERPAVVRCGDRITVWMTNAQTALSGERVAAGGSSVSYTFTGGAAVIRTDRATVLCDNGFVFDWNNGAWKVWLTDESDTAQLGEMAPTIPHLIQGGDPAGGGDPLQAVNLLTPWVTESFCCTQATTKFQLNQKFSYRDYNGNLQNSRADCIAAHDDTDLAILNRSIKVEVLTAGSGEAAPTWTRRAFVQGDGAESWNAYVVIAGGIGATPIDGEDNVRITYMRRKDAYQAGFRRLCAAVCGCMYGVGGWRDRLFLGGGNESGFGVKNRLYYSEMDDPLYIGDLNYLETEAGTALCACDGTGAQLAAITDRGICLISGSARSDNGSGYAQDALFTVSAQLKAPAPLNKNNTAVLGGEVVYLSEDGVIAVAAHDNYDERYAEHRSALIDRRLMADAPRRLMNFGSWLLIFCAGGVCWLLDENQPNKEGDRPYSTHQYEGWRLTNFYAEAAYNDGGALKIYYSGGLYTWAAGGVAADYHDEWGDTPAAITARWETPWLYGGTFYRKKVFMKLGLLLGLPADTDTAVRVEAKKNNEDWAQLWDYDGALCVFDYRRVNYRLLTYRTAPGCPDLQRKIKIKKALRVKLRFTNDFYDHPFILREYGLDYVQEG